MKLRNLLLGCSAALVSMSAVAADFPEELYLVGTMNEWSLPADGKLVKIPSVSEGVYSATMDLPADHIGSLISFKIFNTLATDWLDASQYYGAIYPNNYSAVYKDTPAIWTLAPGYGSSNFSITNVSQLEDAVITINLKENTVSIASPSAPAAPQEIYVAEGTVDGPKHALQRVGDSSEFKGKVNLAEGVQKLFIVGNNNYLLGGDNDPYYLWKDKDSGFTMVTNSEAPFIVGNWKSGEMEITVNIINSLVTFNTIDQPAFPETINLLVKNEDGDDLKYPMVSTADEWGQVTFSCTLERNQKDLQFAFEVPGLGKLFTNSKPIELFKNVQNGCSLSPEYSDYITVSNWEGGSVTVSVFETFFSGRMISDTQPMRPMSLYLIGNPQGWDIKDGSMELTQIDAYKFEGEFDMPEGPIFRFYTELGNWESNSIGSQYADNSVEVTLTADKELDQNMVYGKGSWSFVGLPAGKMYMEVDLRNMKATFSLSPISGIGSVSNDDVTIKGTVGGLEISAPDGYETVVYDLTGCIVAKCSGCVKVSLQPGIYITNGTKLIVR